MELNIVSPEAQLFSGEVFSITVPGASGSFQILNNHAPIVSSLVAGKVKIQGKITLDESVKHHFIKEDEQSYFLDIISGAIEVRENKIILLTD